MHVNLANITPRAALLCTALAMALLSVEAALAQSNLPVCPLIATGGTIAMKIDPVKQAPVPAISGEDLLATVPDVAKHAKVEVKNVSNVPSDYMDPPRWIALTKEVAAALERPEVAGVIISHGTDTLEETAWWLDLTVNSDKPMILIGAQRNASEKDFDGPRNLLNAVRICVDPQSRGKGAMIALNDQINAARDVTKTHTSSVETFKSGDFGFLGVVDQDRVIPRSRHDPKILWVDDAEIVGDRITKVRPIPRNLFTQKTERRIGELRASCVALVVSDVSVHEAP